MAVQLPIELIFEILSRLPSKSILRCRSVCKSWLSLVSSTQFILDHLHNSNNLNPRNIVCRFDRRQGEVFSVHLDDQHFTLDPTATIEFPLNISRDHLAYFRLGWKFNMIGSCHGVVCLYNRKTKEDEVILWNPSIRKKVTTSAPPVNNNRYWLTRFLVFGFGYDTISDDYKVVRLAYDGVSISFRPQVKVYAVKTDIWSTVGFPHDLPCFSIFPNQLQTFFNGSVHWISSEPKPGVSHKSIMAFDINTEVFEEIQLPDDLAIGEFETTMVLSVLRGSLAVICFEREAFVSSTYKIWAMKEYKKPATWTLLYDMNYSGKDLGKPLRLRNNGDIIMDSDNGDLLIYNHNMNVCYYVYSSGFDKREVDHKTYVDKYQESLVLLDVGHSVPNDNE